MKLAAGIKVTTEPPIDLSNRLFINDGVENAYVQDHYEDLAYIERAVKPRQTWRQPSPEEFSTLTAIEPSNNFSNTISLRKLSPDIIELAKEIGLENIESQQQLVELFQQCREKVEELNEKMEAFARSRFLEDKEELLIFKTLAVIRQNLNTIAVDKKVPKYLGMHIDISIGVDFDNTCYSPNRMGINFGKGNRYLLIINKTVKEVIEMLREKGETIDPATILERDLVAIFFQHYPSYPVVRITQKPYEIYIAPTDNLIHDGSTIGKAQPDVVLFLAGYFNPL